MNRKLIWNILFILNLLVFVFDIIISFLNKNYQSMGGWIVAILWLNIYNSLYQEHLKGEI